MSPEREQPEWRLLLLLLPQSFPTLGMLLSAERDLRIMDRGDLTTEPPQGFGLFSPSRASDGQRPLIYLQLGERGAELASALPAWKPLKSQPSFAEKKEGKGRR